MKIDLKKFRQMHDIQQSSMAEILGLNQSNISRAESRGFHDLTYPQEEELCKRYGREDVEKYAVEDRVNISNNNNTGKGTQNNGIFGASKDTLDIIRQQSDALISLATKQAELNEKLMLLIDKLSQKL